MVTFVPTVFSSKAVQMFETAMLIFIDHSLGKEGERDALSLTSYAKNLCQVVELKGPKPLLHLSSLFTCASPSTSPRSLGIMSSQI